MTTLSLLDHHKHNLAVSVEDVSGQKRNLLAMNYVSLQMTQSYKKLFVMGAGDKSLLFVDGYIDACKQNKRFKSFETKMVNI
jgi:hypothetical protein